MQESLGETFKEESLRIIGSISLLNGSVLFGFGINRFFSTDGQSTGEKVMAVGASVAAIGCYCLYKAGKFGGPNDDEPKDKYEGFVREDVELPTIYEIPQLQPEEERAA